MRTLIATLMVTIALQASAMGQLPAQKGKRGEGARPTAVPPGKQLMEEPTRTSEMKLKKVDGGARQYAAIAQVDYFVGVRGYPTQSGLAVMSTFRRKDYDKNGRGRCPAEEIEVDFQGNGRLIKVKLEPGDVIVAIDGIYVTTPAEVSVAVNSADNPHDLEIVFIDWRTGNEYVGKIDAMKITR